MNSETKVYKKKPEDFFSKVEVAATYVNVNGTLLFLENGSDKHEKGRWGVPAGKIEIREDPKEAAKRELFEETGIDIKSNDVFQSLGELYIRKTDFDYTFHLFCVNLKTFPSVYLSNEHCSYQWVTREEAEKLSLMDGAKEALNHYYESLSKKVRSGASVNAYLVLRKDDQVLLQLRKNTGYFDGYYCLLAGHVEDGESATVAMVREAHEEAGIQIEAISLKAVHVMHRQTNRLNMDVFFECSNWQGILTNCEPDKCESLEYFPLSQLPINTIDYIKDALQEISKQSFYSEQGWE